MLQYILLGLACANCGLLILLIQRRHGGVNSESLLTQTEKLHDRTDRLLRDEIGQSRAEAVTTARHSREELNNGLKNFAEVLVRHIGQIATLQKGQLDTFSGQLTAHNQSNEQRLEAVRNTVEAKLNQIAREAADHAAKGRDEDKRNFDGFCQLLMTRINEAASQQRQQLLDFQTLLKSLTESNTTLLTAMRDTIERKLGQIQSEATQNNVANREEASKNLKIFGDSLLLQITQIATAQRQELEKVAVAIAGLTQTNEQTLEKVRETVEARLTALQTDNATKLEAMRQTVDEKLQGTLDKRLGESFKQVSERLEAVFQGLGEMRALAVGVGDLKKVLTNVKTRGTWGEVQLGALLEQVLAADQYASNVATKDGGERVEFAIKFPGGSEDARDVLWLPIDAKFPIEDYQRLVEAQERADPEGTEAAAKQLENCVKKCAWDICEKYIGPPKTTNFGILFLPIEGLFAEVIRRGGLAEFVQRECRVVIAGPTTLWSILNSLQMGFRTLAIQKRSSEVWNLLAAVKTEFAKYGEVLSRVQKKLEEASETIDKDVAVRTRVINRKLRDVQELPAADASSMLILESSNPEGDGDDS